LQAATPPAEARVRCKRGRQAVEGAQAVLWQGACLRWGRHGALGYARVLARAAHKQEKRGRAATRGAKRALLASLGDVFDPHGRLRPRLEPGTRLAAASPAAAAAAAAAGRREPAGAARGPGGRRRRGPRQATSEWPPCIAPGTLWSPGTGRSS
jgi:hypothetical protein